MHSFTGSRQTQQIILLLFCLLPFRLFADVTYQPPRDFLKEVFGDKLPPARVIWITGKRRTQVEKILGHRPRTLRLRYWAYQGKRVWILEDIGKERLITTGIVVAGQRIEQMKVLIYRESRGSEVHYPFFMEQFRGATLTSAEQLDRPIDGISGATLSVRALKRLARLALYLSLQLEEKH